MEHQKTTGRQRTWSRYTAKGRLPSEYEIVTHDLLHHVGREVPFEVSPDAPWNRWTAQYRDQSCLRSSAWNDFRDPDALIYRTYVEMQDEREVYVDGLLAEFRLLDHDSALDFDWVQGLGQWYTPSRYVGHALQMAAMYLVQMAPSSYLANCASFQAADELRRVQRLAYRTRELATAYPAAGLGEQDRQIWEDGDAWQPLRRVIEQLLVVRDWGEAFVRINLVVKPLIDNGLLAATATVAREQGDHLLALINDDLYLDSLRSRRWSSALVSFLTAENVDNAGVIAQLIEQHSAEARDAVLAALEPLEKLGLSMNAASVTLLQNIPDLAAT
jgi:toluene monooxygenase system protein E